MTKGNDSKMLKLGDRSSRFQTSHDVSMEISALKCALPWFFAQAFKIPFLVSAARDITAQYELALTSNCRSAMGNDVDTKAKKHSNPPRPPLTLVGNISSYGPEGGLAVPKLKSSRIANDKPKPYCLQIETESM
jgi:hypothetical protein